MATTREEFAAWRASQSWQELFSKISEGVSDAASTLCNRKKPDTDEDQYLRGYIFALSEVSAFEPTFITDEEGDSEEA